MKISELQEYIEKSINECGLKPDDEAVIYDAFHNDYNEIEFVYADKQELTIQF